MTAAILSAVRSCSSRPTSGAYVRRGNNTVTLVPGWLSISCSHQLLRRATQVTIRALERPQRNLVLEVLPALLQSRGVQRIDHEVHRGQLVGVQPVCVMQRLDRREVEVIDEDEDAMPRML